MTARQPDPAGWFRRPDGGLVHADSVRHAIACRNRGWEPVDTDKAVKEVKEGHQKALAARQRAASDAVDKAHEQAQADAKKAARDEQVSRMVAEARKNEPDKG